MKFTVVVILQEDKVRSVKVKALVDSGAYTLWINENIKNQLGLCKVDEMDAERANGKLEKVDIAGPIVIKLLTRRTTVDAAVLPGDSEVLLGCIPLEDMDLLIDSREEMLKLPPDRKYLAKKKIKNIHAMKENSMSPLSKIMRNGQ